jgi:filamentous hemagglutinin family protein
MVHRWKHWSWKLGIVSTLAIAGSIIASFDCVKAQITPDNTLGAESSVVTPNVLIKNLPSDQIEGGAVRGPNLFHSFREFNIDAGRGAYFTNPSGIENILSRVTGGNPSNILGTLGVTGGNANLFLINPNGIIFGPNASLDVGGSFLATTANAVQFGEQGFFSASAPNASSVLTVNPSAFLFNQIAAQPITNQATAGLQVPDGRSLLLLGSNVKLEDGGTLLAPGGRVELGGLSGAGTVGLDVDGNNLDLSFPDQVARADVSLTNGASVNVAAGGGGSIAVNARNLDLSGGSNLFAGIGTDLGSVGAQAGDITLNATEAITVANESLISNRVGEGAVGNGGEVNITTGSLSVMSGAGLTARTYGQGDAGSVNINARDAVSFDRGGYAYSTVEAGAVGKGGNVNVTAGSLSLAGGAQIQALVRGASDTLPGGRGNAGSVNINARDTVSFDGVGTNELSSGAFSTVQLGAVGDGGSVNITTGSLYVKGGAVLSASTFGQGDGGSVNINAYDTVSFDGVGTNKSSSGAYSQVGPEAVGKGGGITITTGSLSLTDGAVLSVSTFGQGSAGSVNINARDTVSFEGVGGAYSQVGPGAVGKGGDINVNITTGSLSVKNGAQLNASTLGQGDGGSVNINARDKVTFDGVGSDGFFSGAYSQVGPGAVGKGGNINIMTGSLFLTNRAVLNANTLGQGDAGSIFVQADGDVSLAEIAIITTAVGRGGEGNGGDIDIQTQTLNLTGGSQVAASVAGAKGDVPGGQGKGGNIRINATESVNLSGVDSTGFPSVLRTNIGQGASGQAGDIIVDTDNFRVANGAVVAVSSQGLGNAGNLEVVADSIRLDNQGELTAETASGQGGNIALKDLDLLLLRNNSQISTTADTAQVGADVAGGNINIDTDFLVAVPAENSDITANAFAGRGGNVQINTQGIFGIQFQDSPTLQSDITASSQFGVQGTVDINTPDVDPSQGLVALPEEVVDASGLIAQDCPAAGGSTASRFVVTGRGGLPPNPNESLSSDAVVTGLVTLDSDAQNRSSTVSSTPAKRSPAPLKPAKGWVMNDKGEVTLTAQAPTSAACDTR